MKESTGQPRKKEEGRKRKRQKRIGYKKTKMKKIYASFRE